MILIYTIVLYIVVIFMAYNIKDKKIIHPSNSNNRLSPITYIDENNTKYFYKKIDCDPQDYFCKFKYTKSNSWNIIYYIIAFLAFINLLSIFFIENFEEVWISSIIVFVIYNLAPIYLFHSEDSNIIKSRVYKENLNIFKYKPIAY